MRQEVRIQGRAKIGGLMGDERGWGEGGVMLSWFFGTATRPPESQDGYG